MILIDCNLPIPHSPYESFPMMHYDPIVQYRYIGRLLQKAIFEMRGLKNNVVYLPYPRPSRSIDEGRILPVYSCSLAICIRKVLK